jgi:hypothetical protein
MTGELWIVNDVERTGHDQISWYYTILAFAWRDLGKLRETSVTIPGPWTEILSGTSWIQSRSVNHSNMTFCNRHSAGSKIHCFRLGNPVSHYSIGGLIMKRVWVNVIPKCWCIKVTGGTKFAPVSFTESKMTKNLINMSYTVTIHRWCTGVINGNVNQTG